MAYKPRGRPRGRPKINASSSPINIRLLFDQAAWLENVSLSLRVSKADIIRAVVARAAAADIASDGKWSMELFQ